MLVAPSGPLCSGCQAFVRCTSGSEGGSGSGSTRVCPDACIHIVGISLRIGLKEGGRRRQLTGRSAQLYETLPLPLPSSSGRGDNHCQQNKLSEWMDGGGWWCVTATQGCPATGEQVGVPAKTRGLAIYFAGLWSPGAGSPQSRMPETLTAAAGAAYTESNVCFFSYVWYAMLSRGLPCLPVAVPCDEFRNDSTVQTIHLNVYFQVCLRDRPCALLDATALFYSTR